MKDRLATEMDDIKARGVLGSLPSGSVSGIRLYESAWTRQGYLCKRAGVELEVTLPEGCLELGSGLGWS